MINDDLARFPATPGYCYRDSARLVVEGWIDGGVLCHGVPRLTRAAGGSPAGTRFGHAWVELNGMVYDHNHLTRPYPRDLYYRIGQINPNDVRRYTMTEVYAKALTTGHWGPWDPTLEELEG